VSRPSGDGLPWYRHVWPWFIVLLLSVAVVGSIATVVVAFRGQDALVRDDWYSDGLAINRSLERIEEARTRDIRAELHLDPEQGRVAVTLQGEGTGTLERLRLVLSHATRAEHDETVDLAREASGRFVGALAPRPPGRYYASLEPLPSDPSAPLGAPAWQLGRAFFAGASPSVRLGGGS